MFPIRWPVKEYALYSILINFKHFLELRERYIEIYQYGNESPSARSDAIYEIILFFNECNLVVYEHTDNLRKTL